MSKLTVHNAQVSSATVEVKTLTVSGRQVTLAVFRQLLEEDLIAADGTLNGVPWGTVNYHPDGCAKANAHWHVVWQQGSDLRRSQVSVTPTFPAYLWVDEFYNACLAAELHGTPDPRFFGTLPSSSIKHQQVRLDDGDYVGMSGWLGVQDGLPVAGEVYAPVLAAIEAAKQAKVHERGVAEGDPYAVRQQEDAVVKVREAIRKVGELNEECSLDDLWIKLQSDVKAELERRQRQSDVRKAIADLPQLFIAV